MTTAVPATAVLDFGATPSDVASVVITGLADMTATAHIEVFMQDDDTTVGLGGLERNAAWHESLALFAILTAKARSAGVGFTISARLAQGKATGKYLVHYIYVV